MISIIKKSQTETVIVFEKVTNIFKRELLNTIINAFSEKTKYLIEICGVDLHSFIEDMQSSIYLLECDKTKRLIKKLPQLYALCDCYDDVNLFGKTIGSFNEGYMKLHVLHNDNNKTYDAQQILNLIQANKLCSIEVLSDGDVLNLLCDSEERMQSICHLIERSIMEQNKID